MNNNFFQTDEECCDSIPTCIIDGINSQLQISHPHQKQRVESNDISYLCDIPKKRKTEFQDVKDDFSVIRVLPNIQVPLKLQKKITSPRQTPEDTVEYPFLLPSIQPESRDEVLNLTAEYDSTIKSLRPRLFQLSSFDEKTLEILLNDEKIKFSEYFIKIINQINCKERRSLLDKIFKDYICFYEKVPPILKNFKEELEKQNKLDLDLNARICIFKDKINNILKEVEVSRKNNETMSISINQLNNNIKANRDNFLKNAEMIENYIQLHELYVGRNETNITTSRKNRNKWINTVYCLLSKICNEHQIYNFDLLNSLESDWEIYSRSYVLKLMEKNSEEREKTKNVFKKWVSSSIRLDGSVTSLLMSCDDNFDQILNLRARIIDKIDKTCNFFPTQELDGIYEFEREILEIFSSFRENAKTNKIEHLLEDYKNIFDAVKSELHRGNVDAPNLGDDFEVCVISIASDMNELNEYVQDIEKVANIIKSNSFDKRENCRQFYIDFFEKFKEIFAHFKSKLSKIPQKYKILNKNKNISHLCLFSMHVQKIISSVVEATNEANFTAKNLTLEIHDDLVKNNQKLILFVINNEKPAFDKDLNLVVEKVDRLLNIVRKISNCISENSDKTEKQVEILKNNYLLWEAEFTRQIREVELNQCNKNSESNEHEEIIKAGFSTTEVEESEYKTKKMLETNIEQTKIKQDLARKNIENLKRELELLKEENTRMKSQLE